jgi:DNA-binding NtrC family response regulator
MPAAHPDIPSAVRPVSMETTLVRAARYATLPEDILLVGPTGSGKSRLAELIHRASGRTGAFVSVTGGELSDTLWASQLYGHYAGAFTDAKHQRCGYFEQAAGGTLFLDELHRWNGAVQGGLLRPVDGRRFCPLGAERELTVTCRLIFATTMCPDELEESKCLAPDLRHRLPGLRLDLPALAARQGEILPLLEQFTTDVLTRWNWEPAHFCWAPSAVRGLLLYAWPGNIRELQHVVKRTLGQVGPAPTRALEIADFELPPARDGHLTDLLDAEEVERVAAWALTYAQGSRQEAARLLGVHRNTFASYITRWGSAASARPAHAQLGGLGRTADGGVACPESA